MSDFLEESQWVRQVRSPKFEVRVNRTAAHPRFFILHSSFFILHFLPPAGPEAGAPVSWLLQKAHHTGTRLADGADELDMILLHGFARHW